VLHYLLRSNGVIGRMAPPALAAALGTAIGLGRVGVIITALALPDDSGASCAGAGAGAGAADIISLA
jgi:hypothetical protein